MAQMDREERVKDYKAKAAVAGYPDFRDVTGCSKPGAYSAFFQSRLTHDSHGNRCR